ncbi:response regulator [Paraurantiacibacter namhicola]
MPGRGGMEAALVVGAALLSILAFHLFIGKAAATAAFAAGLGLIAAIGWLSQRRGAAPDTADAAQEPDWAATVAATAQPDRAVAITDRANRLVCANATFELWFGSSHAPPHLPVDGASGEKLARAARAGWRDGTAEPVKIADEDRSWTADVVRAGRRDEYLVWRFAPIVREEPLLQLGKAVAGDFGRMLSAAGIEAALVGGDGAIRAVNPGFARRAAGDVKARMTGQDFVAQLRADDRERIYFAREGRKGPPQTLVQIPLADPAATAEQAATAPSVMLLLDAGIGLGGWGGDAQGHAQQLEALLEQLPLGLAMTDRDGHFLFANPAFRRAAGISGPSLPPYPSDLVIRADKTAISDAVRRYGKGPASSGDIAVRLASQPDDPVSLGLAGVRGLGEAAVMVSLADTSEETRLKRQVAQATKMQAVGQLAGGVAHDFNNVLTAIIGYCDLMLLRHTPGDSDYDDIQQIKANSNRAASLTRQLLAFSRQQTLRPEVLQLPDVISEVSQLLKRLMGAKITLKTHHDRDLGPVRADPRQLEQVIVNLAVNARDAIQQAGGGETASGTLTFATRRVRATDIQRMRSEIIPAGNYTALIAQDTGGGIPQASLPKIFEPFFTTKEQGKGTGLGLSTVYGIVKQSGGFIFADNVTDADGRRGARFSIYLPVYEGDMPEDAEADASDESHDWSRGARILLVEDEDMVRAVAERALARAGHTVTTAADGEEGLAAYAKGEGFDIVVSDVVMPGMDGPTMVKALRKQQGDLPVLFMSGYAEEQLREEIDVANMHFLAKPFSVQQIGDAVTKALNASGPGARKGA